MSKRPRQPEDAAAHDPLQGKRVVLCVTGGIAAYKSAYLTRALVRAGAGVVVVMTEAAQRFVAPLTFETLSGNRVVTSTFERVLDVGAVEHIDLAEWADLVIVAPATYNFLGKLRAGIADDVVTTFISAVTSPAFIAPAMNEHMWRNPINQHNVEALRALGYHFVDPERGGLACSWEGEGRMSEPDAILSAVRRELPGVGHEESARSHGAAIGAQRAPSERGVTGSPLADRTVLVTAAGTHEAIDPVRYVGNRSSGRMGYALAAGAAQRGARVLLISGPSSETAPGGIAEFRSVESAEEMLQASRAWVTEADVLLMAAAVADYRPRKISSSKIKRTKRPAQLELEPTPDILDELGAMKGERFFVGFVLETGDPEGEARRKLESKRLDLVVANRVGDGTGPEARTNQVWIYDAQGLVLQTPVLDKPAVAEIILNAVETELLRRTEQART
ncbi:MAG: bifunctional phosphopantothenoylcysteine decarboxylase/phosphopantothenate--cysteine ligase CoaBC [Candidatus Krumholzibacteriia bacterium]